MGGRNGLRGEGGSELRKVGDYGGERGGIGVVCGGHGSRGGLRRRGLRRSGGAGAVYSKRLRAIIPIGSVDGSTAKQNPASAPCNINRHTR
jgi:hypothetical protein